MFHIYTLSAYFRVSYRGDPLYNSSLQNTKYKQNNVPIIIRNTVNKSNEALSGASPCGKKNVMTKTWNDWRLLSPLLGLDLRDDNFKIGTRNIRGFLQIWSTIQTRRQLPDSILIPMSTTPERPKSLAVLFTIAPYMNSNNFKLQLYFRCFLVPCLSRESHFWTMKVWSVIYDSWWWWIPYFILTPIFITNFKTGIILFHKSINPRIFQ